MPTPWLAMLQTAEIAEALDVIVVAQIVMAAVMVVILLMLLGAAVAGLVVARRLGKRVKGLERRLEPKLEPLLDSADRIVHDVADLTGRLKTDAEGIRLTMSEANLKLRELIDATELRVRRLGQVIDVAQEETEKGLLDVASTARGVQTTARRLRAADAEDGAASAARVRRESLRVDVDIDQR